MVITNKNNQTKEKSTKQPPVVKLRAYPITLSVWANEIKTEEKEFTSNTVTIERSYKDKDGKYHNTNSFTQNDLPKIVMLCNKAFESLSLSDTKKEEEN